MSSHFFIIFLKSSSVCIALILNFFEVKTRTASSTSSISLMAASIFEAQ
jgi:hypothetical protein